MIAVILCKLNGFWLLFTRLSNGFSRDAALSFIAILKLEVIHRVRLLSSCRMLLLFLFGLCYWWKLCPLGNIVQHPPPEVVQILILSTPSSEPSIHFGTRCEMSLEKIGSHAIRIWSIKSVLIHCIAWTVWHRYHIVIVFQLGSAKVGSPHQSEND